MEAIGLAAILEDANFQKGLERYHQGVGQMEHDSDSGASAMTRIWSAGGIAVGIAAAGVAAAVGGIVAVSKVGLDTLKEWGGSIDELSDRLGTTGEASSTFAVAMNHVGLSVDEGGAGINFFIKNLDNLKAGMGDSATVTKSNDKAVAGLNQQLSDAETRLQRAQKALSESKKPTDSMRYAVDDAQKAVDRLNEKLAATPGVLTSAAKPLTPFAAAFKTLGVSAFDVHGKLLPVEQLMPKVMDAFEKMPNSVSKTALAMDLFGARGGTRFIDFLSQGSAGLERARTMAELYGLSVSTDMSNDIEQLGFAQNDTNLALKGFWVIVGKAVLPVAIKFVNMLNTRLVPPLLNLAKFVAPLLATALEKTFNVVGDVLNIIELLATGNFKGGIFGFTEDSIFIGALLTARDVVEGLFTTLSKGDWTGAWNVIVSGAQKLWNIVTDQIGDPGKFLLGWAVRFWDFLKPIISAIPAKVGGIINGIAGFLNDHGAEMWGKVSEGASGFWSWVVPTVNAIPSQVGGLIGSIAGFFSDHGKDIWDKMSGWASDFWTWLTGPGGALSKAYDKVAEIATEIGNAIQPVWDSTIAPALALWGSKFWDWLVNPTTGALATGSQAIADITGKIKDWVNDPTTQQHLVEGGSAIATGIIEAVKGIFSKDENGKSLIGTLAENMGRASTNVGAIFQSVAQGIAKGMIGAIADELGLDTHTKELAISFGLFLQRVAFAFADSINPFNIAKTLVGTIIDRIRTLLDSPTFSGMAPTPPTWFPQSGQPNPAGAGAGGSGGLGTSGSIGSSSNSTSSMLNASASVQAVPLVLTVQIGNQQISEAVATWSATSVQNIAERAMTLAQNGQ